MSFVLKLSGNTSVLKANYFPPIILDGEFEVAVIFMETWNSIANITSKNNKFYYDQNKEITIPEGSYEISDIQKYLARQLKAEHIKHPTPDFGKEAIVLVGNHSTLKTLKRFYANTQLTSRNPIILEVYSALTKSV